MPGPTLPYAVCRVLDAEDVTPAMRRLTLGADALAEAAPIAPDQQVKLFLARDGGTPEIPVPAGGEGVAGWYARYLAVPEARRPWMRAYTVRHLDRSRGRMQVDFALHDAGEALGPATRWAGGDPVGDEVGVLGPAISSARTPDGQPGRLLVGDATALPAIGATVESLEPGVRAVVVAAVRDAAERQRWASDADVTVHWVHRAACPEDSLLDAVRDVELPPGPVFAWVAGESSSVRAVRRHLVGERGVARPDVSFTGYWRRHLTQDDAPTSEELADRAEVMGGAVTR